MPDNTQNTPKTPDPGKDDDTLDIELEELAEQSELLPPVQTDSDVLDIELEDLSPSAEAGLFPGVTPDQQRAAANSITVPCQCSVTRQPFEVIFEETEPGQFWAVQVLACKDQPVKAGAGAMSQVKGSFRMGEDFACPYCHSGEMSICERCATVLCAGGVNKGGDCMCPGCGATLTLGAVVATAAPAKGKGKQKG